MKKNFTIFSMLIILSAILYAHDKNIRLETIKITGEELYIDADAKHNINIGDNLLFINGKTGHIGINTKEPPFRLSLNNDGGIIAKGLFNKGAKVPKLDPGSYFIWHPRKASLRAGRMEKDSWDEKNIGNYSIALGYDTEASAPFAFAMGRTCISSGSYCSTKGLNAYASGSYSEASGNNATASGLYAYASGWNAEANAHYFPAAWGYNIEATGWLSLARGRDLINNSYNTTVFGQFNEVISATPNKWVYTDPLFIIANGINNENRSNALTILKDGNVGIGTNEPTSLLHLTGDLDLDHHTIKNVKEIKIAKISAKDGLFLIESDWTNKNNKILDLGIVLNAEIRGGTIDNTYIGISTPNAAIFTSLQTGTDGTDGQLIIYSEQGPKDYIITFNPNSAMTENIHYTLPANSGSDKDLLSTNGKGSLSWIPRASVFEAHDSKGGTSINKTWTDIPLDKEIVEDSFYSHAGNSANVIINKKGLYKVSANVSTSVNKPEIKSQSEIRLTLNSSLLGPIAQIYTNGEGKGTATITTFATCNPGDVIKLQARETSDESKIQTHPQGSSLILEWIR